MFCLQFEKINTKSSELFCLFQMFHLYIKITASLVIFWTGMCKARPKDDLENQGISNIARQNGTFITLQTLRQNFTEIHVTRARNSVRTSSISVSICKCHRYLIFYCYRATIEARNQNWYRFRYVTVQLITLQTLVSRKKGWLFKKNILSENPRNAGLEIFIAYFIYSSTVSLLKFHFKLHYF